MSKSYIITNPNDVVAVGRCNLIFKFEGIKYEVQRDLSAFLYYNCLAVVEGNASYADITLLFNYLGFPSRDSSDGIVKVSPEKVISFFEVEDRIGDTIFVRFKLK